MARRTQDREDLMREATALVRRVEFQLPCQPHEGSTGSYVVGFRKSGDASIFVGSDPVFQFNTAGQLRRGYWNGRLIKAERGRLVQLERRPTDDEIQLIRHELTDAQTSDFLRLATETLNRLRRSLESNELLILKRVPTALDVSRELTNWLDSLPQPLAIARTPNVGS